MRIVFFGTPEFALPSLQKLMNSKHEVVGCVTAPDKPRGRGRTVIETPVAKQAIASGLPVLKPENLKDNQFLANLESWQADIYTVVAFRILPEAVFEMPRFGAINLHGSLLPKYRGAAPIQWAIWNGDKQTGVTTFLIQKQVDTGNILKQAKVEILDEDDAGSLSDKLANVGAELLLETIDGLEAGTLAYVSQNSDLATKAPKITKEHCLIDWEKSAVNIHNQIRALSPIPGAFSLFEGVPLKFYRSEVIKEFDRLKPGEMSIADNEIVIGTRIDGLKILELQVQGKKRMDTLSFLRGFRPRGVFQLQEI